MRNGLARMAELGAIPEELKDGGTGSLVTEGLTRLLSEGEQERFTSLILESEDITEQLYEELDDIYIRNLPF